MKKLILIFALLITVLSYGQITKFQVAGYKTLTTIQRDALTVTSGEKWTIYNSDTFQFEYWNGTVWVALVGDGATNLSYNAPTREVVSDTGTNAVLTLVDGTNAGLASPSDKVKIDGALQSETDPLSWAKTGTTVVTTPTITGDINFDGNIGIGITPQYNMHIEYSGGTATGHDIIGLIEQTTVKTSGSTRFNIKGASSEFRLIAYGTSATGVLAGSSAVLAIDGDLVFGAGTTGKVIKMYTSNQTSLPALTISANNLVDIVGKLMVQTDPTIDAHVGNRLFNDGRYGQLATDNDWTGFSNKFWALEVGDPTLSNPNIDWRYSGETGVNQFNMDTNNFGITYKSNSVLKIIDGFSLNSEVQTIALIDADVTGYALATNAWSYDKFLTKSADVLSQAVSYTTDSLDTGRKIDFTGGTVITLDDAGVNIGDQFDFYNNTGSPMSWAFGSGDGSIETISDLPDKTHGYARLVAANSWTVIDGVSSGGSGTVTEVLIGGFNNPISVGTSTTTPTLTYNRNIPMIIGNTPRTIADNWTGVMFTNDQATALTITIPDTLIALSGWQFSAAKFGTGDVILDPTGTTTINGSTATITITTQYDGVIQMIYIGGNNWHLIGTL